MKRNKWRTCTFNCFPIRVNSSKLIFEKKKLHFWKLVQHLLQLWMAPERTQPQEIDNLIILLASYVDEATPSLFCLSTNIFSAVLLSRFVAAAAAAIFGCVSTSSSVKERRERRVNIFFSDFSLSAQKEDVH